MWVEVKDIDSPPSQQTLDIAAEELRGRLDSLPGNYGVQAWVTSGFDARAAKLAVRILKQELERGLDPSEQLLIAVPSGSYTQDAVQIRWTSVTGASIRFVTIDNNQAGYGCPGMAAPNDWTDDVEFTDENGTQLIEAFKVISDSDPNTLTFWVSPAGQHVGLGGVGSAQATQLNTIDRIRRCIDKAAKQIKSGQFHKEAPGVVEIYNDHLPANREQIYAACFGDLTCAFNPSLKNVSSFYGMNGAFRANNNTSVSAVIYRSRLFKSVSVINSFAKFPVAERWLDGDVINTQGESLACRASSSGNKAHHSSFESAHPMIRATLLDLNASGRSNPS